MGQLEFEEEWVSEAWAPKYHCRDCEGYTTTDAGARDWDGLYTQIEQLHHEGMSQHAISQVTTVNRPTIIAYLKKKHSDRLAKP